MLGLRCKKRGKWWAGEVADAGCHSLEPAQSYG